MKIRKDIFESEEELRQILGNIIVPSLVTASKNDIDNYKDLVNVAIKYSKNLELIKKSPVKEFRDLYISLDLHRVRNFCEWTYNTLIQAEKAIRYLTNEVKNR